MAILLVVLIAIFSPLSYGQEKTESEIPPLDLQMIRDLLLFEFEGINQEDLDISNIRQLDDRAKVILLYQGEEVPLELLCKKTDFGPRWRLVDPEVLKILFKPDVAPPTVEKEIAAEAKPEEQLSELEQVELPQETDQVESERKPAKRKGASYQMFLRKFIQALRDEGEQDFSRFYFRDSDFDFKNAAAEEGSPGEALEGTRQEFIEKCKSLSAQLKSYKTLDVQTFFASSSSKAERKSLKEVMPGARRFRASVSVEVLAGDNLGKLIFEGLVQLEDGWRIGKIAAIELPRIPES